MYTVVLKPLAISMAKDAYNWYEEQKEGFGELFLKELNRCYVKLEKHPLIYQKIKKDYRHMVLNTFPYVLVFEIIKTEIVIFAVFHTSKSPKSKFKRK